MAFKKAEMAKTLRNGLSMVEMNPLNHNWSHFVILLGLTLHQFQKKLLLSLSRLVLGKKYPEKLTFSIVKSEKFSVKFSHFCRIFLKLKICMHMDRPDKHENIFEIRY